MEKENPVRFIDAFVDSLNMEKLGFKHALPINLGRPPYNPSDLLKLYVYGYLNQIRSSRKLERECHRNVEVMWLMKKLAPDFKTVADFRKDNADCVKGVFKEFVKLCIGLDLYGSKLVAPSKFASEAQRLHSGKTSLQTSLLILMRITSKVKIASADAEVGEAVVHKKTQHQ